MDLHRIAATMPLEAFEQQPRPFVLVQRPPDEVTQQCAQALGARLDGQTVEGLGLVHDGDQLIFFGDARFPMMRTATLRQRLTTGRFRTPECSCCR
jgi:hypothetical protein